MGLSSKGSKTQDTRARLSPADPVGPRAGRLKLPGSASTPAGTAASASALLSEQDLAFSHTRPRPHRPGSRPGVSVARPQARPEAEARRAAGGAGAAPGTGSPRGRGGGRGGGGVSRGAGGERTGSGGWRPRRRTDQQAQKPLPAYPRAVRTVALAEDDHSMALDEAQQAAPQLLAGRGGRAAGPRGGEAGPASGWRRHGHATDIAQPAVGSGAPPRPRRRLRPRGRRRRRRRRRWLCQGRGLTPRRTPPDKRPHSGSRGDWGYGARPAPGSAPDPSRPAPGSPHSPRPAPGSAPPPAHAI